MTFREQLLKSWQQPNTLSILLWPLSQLYRLLFWARSVAYQSGLLNSYRASVPVIVVGNITVGGTGKTPMVIYLVELLRQHGYRPGVISRGYSGSSQSYPLSVVTSTPVTDCGDEPALIVKRCRVPMVVGADRSASITKLLADSEIDIIISDDGLQHLALQRDLEICIEDMTNASQNSYLLPAGPYRESNARLSSVDMRVQHFSGEPANSTEHGYQMSLTAGGPQPLLINQNSEWQANVTIHAVAGIGNPQRFFNTCRALGLDIIEHTFADHHQFRASDIEFDDELPILMTEKDAIKCLKFASPRHWYLPVNAKLDNSFDQQLLHKLGELKSG